MKTASFLENLEFKQDKPAIKVMLETESTKEIRIAMDSGQIMKEHKAPFPIAVQILEGTIDFGVEGKVLEMKTGDLISLESNVPHDLKANQRSIIRLTLSKKDSASRVAEVVE